MRDNDPIGSTHGDQGVHTHLKGRIFNTEGTSYLVLSEPGGRPECVRVKALNADRTVVDMHCEEVERLVTEQSPARAGDG